MKKVRYEYLKENQFVDGSLVPLNLKCFIPGCNNKAAVRVVIDLGDKNCTRVIPCLCAICATKLDTETIAEYFI